MTDESATTVLPEEKECALIVGCVIGYFSRAKAAAITILADNKIVLGDRLRFGPRPDARKPRVRTITVTRIEHRHQPLAEARGPKEVAVFTGHNWIGPNTPVFRIVSGDIVDG